MQAEPRATTKQVGSGQGSASQSDIAAGVPVFESLLSLFKWNDREKKKVKVADNHTDKKPSSAPLSGRRNVKIRHNSPTSTRIGQQDKAATKATKTTDSAEAVNARRHSTNVKAYENGRSQLNQGSTAGSSSKTAASPQTTEPGKLKVDPNNAGSSSRAQEQAQQPDPLTERLPNQGETEQSKRRQSQQQNNHNPKELWLQADEFEKISALMALLRLYDTPQERRVDIQVSNIAFPRPIERKYKDFSHQLCDDMSKDESLFVDAFGASMPIFWTRALGKPLDEPNGQPERYICFSGLRNKDNMDKLRAILNTKTYKKYYKGVFKLCYKTDKLVGTASSRRVHVPASSTPLQTLCGSLVEDGDGKKVQVYTVGGLVILNGQYYAITASHKAQDDEGSEDDKAEETASLEGILRRILENDEMDDDVEPGLELPASPEEVAVGPVEELLHAERNSSTRYIERNDMFVDRESDVTGTHWSLMRLKSLDDALPNFVPFTDSLWQTGADISEIPRVKYIHTIATDPSPQEVIVISGSGGLIRATMSTNTGNLFLSGQAVEVWCLTFSRVDGPGMSCLSCPIIFLEIILIQPVDRS